VKFVWKITLYFQEQTTEVSEA